MPRSMKEIIEQADELAAAFENYEPNGEDRGKASPLVALHLAALEKARAEEAILAAVAAARSEGLAWKPIGLALGTTGEAARQRYSGATVKTKPRQARDPRT